MLRQLAFCLLLATCAACTPLDASGTRADAGEDGSTEEAGADSGDDVGPDGDLDDAGEVEAGGPAQDGGDPDSAQDGSGNGAEVCTGLVCDGICVPNDQRHCGACDHDCTRLPNLIGAVTCEAGRCVFDTSACAPGYAHCSARPDDGCETDLSNPAHCGDCTTTCRAPAPLCSSGTSGAAFECASTCGSAAPALCGQSCVNTNTSPQHCSMCDSPCPAVSGGQPTCNAGVCDFTCNSASFHKCGSSCIANNSVMGCGTSSCTPCTDPANGAPTCNGTTCDVQCDSGYHACNSNSCLSNTSPASCGTRCTPCPAAPANGTATCASGACDFSCATDYIKNGASCLRRNIYVATSGSDTAAGTQAAPYRTYDRALNGAISGQVINFAAGSYAEAFSRAIPEGVTLQRTSGDIGTVVFTGTGTQTVVFAGSGTVRQIRFNTMGAPLRATTGAQTLEGVSTVSSGGPIQLSGSATMTVTDSAFGGSPAAGSEAYASLIRVKESARLTMRGASSLTGNYACGSSADRTSAIYATDATQVDLNGTSILGAFENASLYFDGSAALQMTNCTMDLGAGCGTGSLLYGSTTLVVTGGSYDSSIAVSGANVRLEINGGTYAGVAWSAGSSFRARNAHFDTLLLVGVASMAADLGTAASPGNNTLNATGSASFGLFVQSGSPSNPTIVNCAGNTWQPNVQSADASGHYAAGTVITSGLGTNYYLVGSIELHF